MSKAGRGPFALWRFAARGRKIYETHNVVLHSKTVSIDGVWSMIGSSNVDHRGVVFNDEVDAVVIGSATADELDDLCRRSPDGRGNRSQVVEPSVDPGKGQGGFCRDMAEYALNAVRRLTQAGAGSIRKSAINLSASSAVIGFASR
jgi:hypothetical protein